MGAYLSSRMIQPDNRSVNYDCPVCISSGRLPNASGRFHIINETQCQCNGCHTIFDKSKFYKSYTQPSERAV